MKTNIYAAIIATAVLFSSCDEILDQASITTDSFEYETEMILAPAAQGDHLYAQKIVEANIQQTLEDHGYANVTIKKINITSAVAEIAPGSQTQNFNAVDVLNASIQTDILPKDNIASKTNTMIDATTLSLDPLSIDVADYLESTEYILAIDGVLKEDLADTLKVTFKINYSIAIGLSSSSH